jgi:hypothetical protein
MSRQPDSTKIALIYAAISAVMVLSARAILDFNGVNEFLQIQYLFNYEYEFLNRALVGEVFRQLGLTGNYKFLNLYAYSIAVIAIVMLYFYFSQFRPSTDNQQQLYFLAFFAISPATISHIGFDIGRYDQLNLIILILAVMLVSRGALIRASLLAAVGVFVHQPFVVIFLPLLVAIAIAENGRASFASGVKVAFFPILALAFIMLQGNPEILNERELNSALLKSYPHFRPNSIAASIEVFFLDLPRAFALTIVPYSKPSTWLYLSAAGTYFALLIAVYWQFFKHVSEPKLQLVMIAPFASLALFLLGVDYYRWIALISLNMFLAYAYVSHKMNRNVITDVHSRRLLVTISIFALLGPMGVRSAFPLLNRLAIYFFGESYLRSMISAANIAM